VEIAVTVGKRPFRIQSTAFSFLETALYSGTFAFLGRPLPWEGSLPGDGARNGAAQEPSEKPT